MQDLQRPTDYCKHVTVSVYEFPVVQNDFIRENDWKKSFVECASFCSETV